MNGKRNTQHEKKFRRNRAPHVIALDLEGTLIATATTPVPRPGLYAFLEFCRTHFKRVVVFTSVPENQFRRIAQQLVAQHHAPQWFQGIEYISWNGEKKDLAWIPGVTPDEVILLDDFGFFVKERQQAQWIEISTFDYPFPQDDDELTRIVTALERRIEYHF